MSGLSQRIRGQTHARFERSVRHVERGKDSKMVGRLGMSAWVSRREKLDHGSKSSKAWSTDVWEGEGGEGVGVGEGVGEG